MVAIVADSAANLPGGLAEELGIRLVPLYLRVGERSYRDGLDLATADLYARLARGEGPVSTSAPTWEDFLGAFEATRAGEVLCVTVASTMSGAHAQALVAAERYAGRVVVLDSRSASMAEGFVALEAARAAAGGAGLDEVASRAREVAARARLFATVGTFEFLRRSGRVNALAAWAATALDLKPVFAFVDGAPRGVARPRTRRRALDRIVEETLAAIGGRPAHVAALHAAAEGEARDVLARVEAGAEVVERHVVEATPVIGAHVGPGLVGACLFTD